MSRKYSIFFLKPLKIGRVQMFCQFNCIICIENPTNFITQDCQSPFKYQAEVENGIHPSIAFLFSSHKRAVLTCNYETFISSMAVTPGCVDFMDAVLMSHTGILRSQISLLIPKCLNISEEQSCIRMTISEEGLKLCFIIYGKCSLVFSTKFKSLFWALATSIYSLFPPDI